MTNRKKRRPPTAVDLDNALAAITPEMAAAAHRPAAVTAFADQLRAAQQESIRLIETAENMPGAARHLTRDGIDDWLRLGLLDTFIQWINGAARTCLHMPQPHQPEPVWAAAWKPGLLVCTYCLQLLKVFGDTDKTCDRCGRLCADDGIATITIWFGSLAYQAGACRDCHPDPTQSDRKNTA